MPIQIFSFSQTRVLIYDELKTAHMVSQILITAESCMFQLIAILRGQGGLDMIDHQNRFYGVF